MKIIIEPYKEDWGRQFMEIKEELLFLLKDFNPMIEHFGSTSVLGLAAKPVIDVLVGIQDVNKFELLAKGILESKNYIYMEAYNRLIPKRRLFIRLKDEIDTEAFEEIYYELEDIPHDKLNYARIAHVHVWEYKSENWIRHLAFREYLKFHDDVKLKYENLKKELSSKDWRDGMEYNIMTEKISSLKGKKKKRFYGI